MAIMNDLNRILEITKDAKELFRKKGSSQWQDTDGYPSRKTFQIDIQKKQLFVYEEKEILGFVVCSMELDPFYDGDNWLSNEPYIAIHRLAVSKTAYGKGIGEKIFCFAEEYAKQVGRRAIRIDTAIENDIMLHLITKRQFQPCGLIMIKKDTIIDKRRLAFQKNLD